LATITFRVLLQHPLGLMGVAAALEM